MKIGEIYRILDELSPFETQESWDNSGLLVGSLDEEIERVYLSLDIDGEFLSQVEPNSLIITHHPLIFKGLKSLNFSSYPSSLLREMIKKNISLISMHTNYDVSHLNRYVMSEILGFGEFWQDGFLLYADVDFSFNELCELVKSKFNMQNLRVVNAGKSQIKRLALCTGSGGDMINSVQADAFLTGDLKYHQALEAKCNKLNLIDIGHFESERYFGASLAKYLQNSGVFIIISDFRNPFEYC